MPRTKRRLNRRSLLIGFIAVSLLAVILPRELTGRFINLVQVFGFLQDWTTRAGDTVADLADVSGDRPVSYERYDAVQRENEVLAHQLASATARLTALRQDYEDATGIRQRGLADGRLIPARIVAGDALAWRESRLINAGALSGVKHSALVSSHYFTLGLEGESTARTGLAVLAGEALVGFVEQVGTHTARVRLLTDRQTRMPVLIARLRDGAFLPLEAEFWLEGTGGPKLQVRDVDHRYVESEAIAEGDYILSVARDPRLPAAMTVGIISGVHADQDNSLLYWLEVAPAIAPDEIRRVFVVDVGEAEAE